MPRQRLGLPHSWATSVGQKIMVVPAVASIYVSGVVLALAAGAAPGDVDQFTGYQTVYERLGAINPADWSQATTVAVAVAGIAGLLIFASLGWAQRLIPHVTRSAIVLRDEDDGTTTVSPRAVERAIEIAARHDGVRGAKATLAEDDIHVALHASRADLIPAVLEHTKTSAVAALSTAGLPQTTTVRVTVTRFTSASKKELLK